MGYSPERIDPGNPTWRLENTPKVVSGIDAASLEVVEEFYGRIVEQHGGGIGHPGGRTHQTPREHLPAREHCSGQRAGHVRRRSRDRRLGGHRRRLDQAVRLHAVHPRARRRRPLPAHRPELPVVEGPPQPRPALPLRRVGQRRQRAHARLRRPPPDVGPQPHGPFGQRLPCAHPRAWPTSAIPATPARRPARSSPDRWSPSVPTFGSPIPIWSAIPWPSLWSRLTPDELAAADAVVLVTDHDAFDYDLVGHMPATCSTPATDWTAPPSNGSDAIMRVIVTGGAGFIGANLCRTLLAAPGVDDVVALDDLSTGSTANLAGVRRRRTGRGIHPGHRPPRPKSCPEPRPSSIWPPARRSPAPPRPHGLPRDQRHRHPAGPGSSPPPRRPPGHRGVVLVRLRRQPHPPQAGGHGPHASQSLCGQQAGRRVVRPGLRPLLRPAHTGLPVLQRLRSAAGTRPRLCRRGPGLPGRGPAGRTAAGARRRLPDPGLHLRRHGLHGAGRCRRASGDQRPTGQPGLRHPVLAPRPDRRDRIAARPPWSAGTPQPRAGDVRDSQADQTKLALLFPDVEPVPLRQGLSDTIDWFRQR